MLIHEQFGIPTPVVESNPYRLTAQRALLGKIALPEGPFDPLVGQYFRPWFAALKEFLESHIDATFPVIVEKTPAPRIRFRISSYYIQQALALPLDEFDQVHVAPTLHDLIPLALKNATTRREFFDFLQHYMDGAIYARICLRHKIKR